MADDVTRDFVLRPNQNEKFRSVNGEALLRNVAEEMLNLRSFESVSSQSDTIASAIRDRLKALNLPHYKFVIQVTIGEQHGQGVNITTQCVWDTDCDGLAKFFYSNRGEKFALFRIFCGAQWSCLPFFAIEACDFFSMYLIVLLTFIANEELRRSTL